MVDPSIPAIIEKISGAVDDESQQEHWNNFWTLEYAAYPGTSLYTNARVIVSKNNISGFAFDTDPMKIDLSQVAVK
jgi:ABC-type transport system substrate-binding protein